MSPRTGRPRLENPRTYVLRIRLTEQERVDLDAVAGETGQKLADWSRDRLIKELKRARRASGRRPSESN